MHLIQIFLPLADNNGKRIAQSHFGDVRQQLVERFGGLTAYTRAPVKGLWKSTGGVARDELVILEVLTKHVSSRWWRAYRRHLEKRFRQTEILIRAQTIRTL